MEISVFADVSVNCSTSLSCCVSARGLTDFIVFYAKEGKKGKQIQQKKILTVANIGSRDKIPLK